MNEYGSATLKYTVVFIYNNINNNNNLTYPSVYLLCFWFSVGKPHTTLWSNLPSHRCTGSLLSLVWAFPLNPSPQYPKALPSNKHSCLIYKIAVTKIFLVFFIKTRITTIGVYSIGFFREHCFFWHAAQCLT